ncbi:DNA cross-link repair 1 protein [Lucilia sericata]|uniref:DNA cross-link repair 1 protein n=1 Tax=Lucilia sericata TaxID=13632 RepID=UPI0018A84B14|nr:DNA cross-link repair 1 protein [Lucilia sericata]
MLQTGKIKIRNIEELQADNITSPKNCLTPLRKRKNPKSASKTKQLNVSEHDHANVIVEERTTANSDATLTKTAIKKLLKTSIKETPSNQKRIDSYFTSCPKTYEIKLPKEEPPTPFAKTKLKTTAKKTNKKTAGKKGKSPRRPKAGRKRLFSESTEPTNESMSDLSSLRGTTKVQTECITINSDSEDDEINVKSSNLTKENSPPVTLTTQAENPVSAATTASDNTSNSQQFASYTVASSLDFGLRMSHTSCGKSTSSKTTSDAVSFSKRKPKPCPPYKIIENTTFAVDAFQFGYIENVTHYFLTHFHADHYIGLTKSFAMPLYMSPITARLLRTFIPVEEQYIHVLELNKPYTINDIEITALDANHCPGSILIVFKFLDTGKCILHTGDFRAWFGMESEPIFWNNQIDTIYLDTTYISDKYAFCTQSESIAKAEQLIKEFQKKHKDKRILYICGSYIVGKEKFWSKLAETFQLKVWAEGNRYKALKAMEEEQFNNLLVEDAQQANMHVIAMGKVTYLELVDYFKSYEEQYDILLAIRPSGWEKDTKPRYSKKINIVGIEYSEHSSYAEMQRFVKFLKPENVISTVPTGKDLMKTAKIPLNWYKYEQLKIYRSYQPTIDSIMQNNNKRTLGNIRPPNRHKGGLEYSVSPLKTVTSKQHEINNNLTTEKAISLVSTNATEMEEPCAIANTPNQENTNNFANQTPALSKTTTSKMSYNSSEYFETPDLAMAAKRLPKKEKADQKEKETSTKSKTPVYTTRKLQPTHKELKEKDTNSREENTTNNSSEYFMRRYMKDVMNQELPNTNNSIKKDQKPNGSVMLNQSLKEENDIQPITSNGQTNSQTSAKKIVQEEQQIVENNIMRKRNLRSKVLSDTTTSSSEQKNDPKRNSQKKKILKQKPTQKTTPIKNKIKKNPIIKSSSSIISIDSLTDDELQTTQLKTVPKTETPDLQDSDDIKTTIFPIKEESPHRNCELQDDFQLTEESQNRNSEMEEDFQTTNQQQLETEAAYNIDIYTNGQTPNTAKQQQYSLENQFKISQNSRSRIKSASSSKATTSTESCAKADKEFEEKLQKISQKTNQISQQKSSKNSTKYLKRRAENPIYKSTTSIESLITDEELQTIKILPPLKTNETSSERSSVELGGVSNIKRLKRSISSQPNASTPFKKSHTTSSLNTAAILNTILESNEDLQLDRFNCSQLAGQIVNHFNQHNPDNSKDHIPSELLSDADDDWI